jgi:hypothetical protein
MRTTDKTPVSVRGLCKRGTALNRANGVLRCARASQSLGSARAIRGDQCCGGGCAGVYLLEGIDWRLRNTRRCAIKAFILDASSTSGPLIAGL